MSRRAVVCLLNGLMVCMAGCTGAQVTPTETGLPLPTIALQGAETTETTLPLPTPSLAATPEESPLKEVPERTFYRIEAFLDYEEHQLFVEQTTTYLNRSEVVLDEILLVLEPHRRAEAFKLGELFWADGEGIQGFTFEDGLLYLPLDKHLSPGEGISFTLSYEYSLPAISGPFGYTARQANLTNWYAFVPPYRPKEGWVVRSPGTIGEHWVYDAADYKVIIRLSDPGLKVAASAPAQYLDTGFAYHLEAGRSFAWSASPEFEVLESDPGDVKVSSYFFPEHAAAGEAVLQTCVQALAVYETLFGPYPYASLSAVEIDYEDGVEADGLFFLGQPFFEAYAGGAQNYLTTLSAHETAHNWWFALVGSDQALEPWLDEALATYSEYLFYEQAHTDLAAWWWPFRVERFAPRGFVDSSIYDHSGFSPYVQAVYLRGALFLHEIRGEVGDDAFFAALQDYADQGRHRQMGSQDFFEILRAHSQADLSPILSEYFTLR